MAAEDTPAAKPESAEIHEALQSGLSDLIPKAADLSERLANMKRQIAAMPSYDKIDPQLTDLEARVDTLTEELEPLKSGGRLNYERLVEFRRSVEAVNGSLADLSQPLLSGLRKIDQWRSDWRTDLEYWRHWKAAAGEDLVIPMVQATCDDALQTIESALERILLQMIPMMSAQKRVFDIQLRINGMLLEVESMIKAARGEFLHDFSPPMYAPTFFAQFGTWLLYDLIAGMKQFSVPKGAFFIRTGWVLGLQIVLSLVIALGIRRSGSILEGIGSLRFMRHKPHSVGWLIAAAACWNLYEPMPALWRLLLMAIILTTTARLVGVIAENRRRTFLVYLLAAILLATRLLISIGLPSPLFRIYLVSIAVGLGFLCTRFVLRPLTAKRTRTYVIILVGTAMACAAVAVIEISGYSALALHIFQSALRTIFIVVLAWLMMLLLRGLLESAFRSTAAQKIPFLQTDTTLVIDRSAKVLNLIILLLFTGAVLQTWRVFTTSVEPINRILTFGITVGGTRITVGLILTAAACLYGALVASRILQFFLMRDVFSRRRVDPGIGISITRLLHYAIVLVGVILALATLGFELTNLTIIASALSVGIGFGLQTIVNNFVCGLILLFERPVRVGDTIQLGDQWATIHNIGLRATTIQTFDRADIVVPNSDLITNQVVNWTLADRNMRIILSVGVAYGSDVPLVLQTLQECTRENRRILEDPVPLIFFMGFGDSSLDFQLRVWIDDIDYMNVVRSELNQAIDHKFRERGIEIPFPQRDLHLRSVDLPATEALAASFRADAETNNRQEIP
jgi:small-conductance mechanosensitive channel